MVEIVVREPKDVKEAVEGALSIPPDGEENLLKFGRPSISFKTRRGFLADSLIIFKKQRNITFTKHHDNIFTLFSQGYEFVLVKIQTGCNRYGGSVFGYFLTIAKNNEVIISEVDDDREYDEWSYRKPVMDLYDVITRGEFRKVPLRHVCGLSGYNPMLGDTCEACEEQSKNRRS